MTNKTNIPPTLGKKPLVRWLNAYSNWKIKNNKDMWICITGAEGTGKSACAVHIATALDNNYINNIKKQIILSTKDMEDLYDLLIERAQQIVDGEKVERLCIHIDEGQLLFLNREAMTTKNRELVKLIQTVRYLNIIWIVCFPTLATIERDLLRRFDVLLFLGAKSDGIYANCYIGDMGLYKGRLYHIMNQIKNIKEINNMDIENLIKRTGIFPDVIAKVPYYHSIYNIYSPIKHQKSLELIAKMKDNENEKNSEKIKEVKKPIIPVKDGGAGVIEKEKVVEIAYKENYYNYQQLSKILGLSVGGMRNKLPNSEVNVIKYNRSPYYKLKDVMELYNIGV